jgi:HD-GYP domain-containing protein (c-di-GMP phosphodiesterase class II)
MRLGKCIYNEEGLILLNHHVELSQLLITRLQQLGIDFLYVEDSATEDVQVDEPISGETRVRALSEIRSNFRSVMEGTSKLKLSKQAVMGKAFGNVMKLIMDDLSSREGTMVMLLNMNVLNNYLFQHSLNVCIYSTLLGMVSGYSKEQLLTLGMGSLLHDIGKTKINLELVKRPRKLSPEEFSEVKKHAEHGFKLLKDEPNIPLLAAHCAFQHHEREDGTGYPRGICGSEIHDFAKWVAITDCYDALTTHRPYRNAMLPHQAMEMLFAGATTLFDYKKVSTFRDNVAIYPIGITVTLDSGEKGVVVRVNPAVPQRPVVRVLFDADSQRITQPFEIDLSTKLTRFVSKVVEY